MLITEVYCIGKSLIECAVLGRMSNVRDSVKMDRQRYSSVSRSAARALLMLADVTAVECFGLPVRL